MYEDKNEWVSDGCSLLHHPAAAHGRWGLGCNDAHQRPVCIRGCDILPGGACCFKQGCTGCAEADCTLGKSRGCLQVHTHTYIHNTPAYYLNMRPEAIGGVRSV